MILCTITVTTLRFSRQSNRINKTKNTYVSEKPCAKCSQCFRYEIDDLAYGRGCVIVLVVHYCKKFCSLLFLPCCQVPTLCCCHSCSVLFLFAFWTVLYTSPKNFSRFLAAGSSSYLAFI